MTDSPNNTNTGTESKQYVGRYRIMSPIGVGSSATVHRGLDEVTDTEVAVKILADNYSLVPEIRQRFLDETSLLMSIRTPAVAQVYGQGETDTGQPYIVLQLADRGQLGQRVDALRRVDRAPNRQDLLVMADHLTEALSVLHRAGIVHRDVSPGNILITSQSASIDELHPFPSVRSMVVLQPDERYLLADLGFAKDLQHASGLTAGGGTRGFAAPEQRDEVTVVDHRADIFGATSLIEWLAEGSSLIDEIEDFLGIGLAEDPEDRYQSMTDWRRGLQRCLDSRPPVSPGPALAQRAAGVGVGGGAGIGGGVDGSETVEPVRSAGRRWTRVAAVGAGIGALALVVGFVVTRSSGPDDELGSVSISGGADSVPETSITDAPPDRVDQKANRPTTEDEATGSTATSQAGESTTQTTGSEITSTTGTTVGPTTALTTAPASTVPATNTTPVVTTAPATTTSVDPRFEFSPRAFIQSPARDSEVSGDLRISGTAQYRDGITGVALIVRRLSDDYVWTPAIQSFAAEWVQIPVGVTPPGGDEVTWAYNVDASDLEPGRYLLRVWARGTDANDPVSDRREIVIPG